GPVGGRWGPGTGRRGCFLIQTSCMNDFGWKLPMCCVAAPCMPCTRPCETIEYGVQYIQMLVAEPLIWSTILSVAALRVSKSPLWRTTSRPLSISGDVYWVKLMLSLPAPSAVWEPQK